MLLPCCAGDTKEMLLGTANITRPLVDAETTDPAAASFQQHLMTQAANKEVGGALAAAGWVCCHSSCSCREAQQPLGGIAVLSRTHMLPAAPAVVRS